MKYLIWSYDYSHASAGPKVLHRLCHELNRAGQEAYVGPWATNPDWDTPTADAPLDGDWTAVYPEIVSGNPWNAPNVARWVLNVPGKLGGDTTYDPSETVFSWHRRFLDAPILHLPAIELDIYTDRHQPRFGAAVYVGKGIRTRDIPGAWEITLQMRADRYDLAGLLNVAEVLYCFDDTSAMAQIALLCGCPVLVVPTGEYLEPQGFRDQYLLQWPAFEEQLADFIRATDRVPA